MSDSAHIFQTVRQAARIEEIIGEHISLRPAGRELVGLCPFHEDRRPSMYVNGNKQIFYCFVCNAGGDVFRFVQNYHKMSPGEALRFLAQRYGVKLPDFRPNDPAQRQRASSRERMLAAAEWAAKWFRENLEKPIGRSGLEYLTGRGLNADMIQAFGLGMALDNWTALAQAASRAGISDESLLGAGLIKQRADGSPFDVFRNRVIFPILDQSGRVIAFGGRILPSTQPADAAAAASAEGEGPKYLNSPETAIFNKRETLYGLNLARQAIIREKTVVVVEGYMDVIACHQAGVANVVATLGTALTDKHINMLRRFAEKVILLFDSDDAGRRAADRAIEMILKYPLDTRITHVPDGKDPFDFCMIHGPEPFKLLLSRAPDALDYKWDQLCGAMDDSPSLAQKQQASMTLLRLASAGLTDSGTDPVRRGLLEKHLADKIGMTPRDVHQTVRNMARAASAQRSSAADIPVGLSTGGAGAFEGLLAAEQWIIGSLLNQPLLWREFGPEFELNLFESPELLPLASRLMEYLEGATNLEACSLADFIGMLEDPALVRLAVQAQKVCEGSADFRKNLTDSQAMLRFKRRGAISATPEKSSSNQEPADPGARVAMQRKAVEQGLTRRQLGPRPPGR